MKILICTDGSRDGSGAIHLGGRLAAQLEAEVTLLVVAEDSRRALERTLVCVTRAMQKSGVAFTPIERRGRLVEEMLAQTLQVEYDLVIVGYCSRSHLEKRLRGCLAARIARELPISVLVVREQRHTIRTVLIGVSAGGFAEECSRWGERVAAAFAARVTLLHVSPAPPLMYGGMERFPETLTEFLQTDTPDARALRRAAAHLVEKGIQVDVRLDRGLTEWELLRVAHDQDVDLLVIGSSWAAQPVSRILLRNITHKVLLNTRRPVLVVRPGGR